MATIVEVPANRLKVFSIEFLHIQLQVLDDLGAEAVEDGDDELAERLDRKSSEIIDELERRGAL